MRYVQSLKTYFTPCFKDSIVNFEHVIAGWESYQLRYGYLVIDSIYGHEFHEISKMLRTKSSFLGHSFPVQLILLLLGKFLLKMEP